MKALTLLTVLACGACTGPLATNGGISGHTDAVRCEFGANYCPSIVQQRVDASFSNIAIETPFAAVRHRLTAVADCPSVDDCPWRDAEGVQHIAWGDRAPSTIILKIVEASDFAGQPIAALGIGLARDRPTVLANIRRFLRGTPLRCGEVASGNVGPVECGATLDPGWIQIGFDQEGRLLRVRFDGYRYI